MSLLYDHSFPIGFGMALAQNLDAMNYFASLDNQAKQSVIDQSHQMHSKEEMRSFVDQLGNHSSFK